MTRADAVTRPAQDSTIKSEPAIIARGVSRSYGDRRAVAGVDLQVDVGEIVAVLGPNGAGKTTLVEILEGLRRRDFGQVSVLGRDPGNGDAQWRARIGAVLQLGTETDEFTVSEILEAHAAYYPDPRSVEEVVSTLDLHDLARRRVKRLSGGQRRRLDLALGIIGNPELLFLDEPTTGLDPEVRRVIWSLIRSLAERGTTIVLTTHYLDEVEHLAPRTVVLVEGKVVWRGRTADLRGGSRDSIVTFNLDESLDTGALPDDLPGIRRSSEGSTVRYETADATVFVTRLMAWADESQATTSISGLGIDRPSLEEAYLRLLDTAHSQEDELR